MATFLRAHGLRRCAIVETGVPMSALKHVTIRFRTDSAPLALIDPSISGPRRNALLKRIAQGDGAVTLTGGRLMRQVKALSISLARFP